MKSMNNDPVGGIAWILLIVGGLNWLLVGLGMWFDSNLNVVNLIFGSLSWLEALVYVLVGLSALYLLLNKNKSMEHHDAMMVE